MVGGRATLALDTYRGKTVRRTRRRHAYEAILKHVTVVGEVFHTFEERVRHRHAQLLVGLERERRRCQEASGREALASDVSFSDSLALKSLVLARENETQVKETDSMRGCYKRRLLNRSRLIVGVTLG